MKKILVTGFDPFGGEKINPALEVIKLLPQKIGDNEIKILEIPTVYKKSLEKIEGEIKIFNPDFILSIGQAGGRADITIERVAINIDDFRIKDNEGNQPIDEKIFENGDSAYFSTLPIKAIQNLVEKKYKNIKSGFIHIPFLPEQVLGKNNLPSMSLETILKAITIAIEIILEDNKDIKKNSGLIC